MIITATPQPENFPPRIRLDINSGGDEFLELTVLRDGRPIRQQPAVMGLSETFVYDYEAPFGVPVTYSARGLVSSIWSSTFTETWANLDGWVEVDSPPSVSGGKLVAGGVSRSIDMAPGPFRIRLASEATLASGSALGVRYPYVFVQRDTSTLALEVQGGLGSRIPTTPGQPVILQFSPDRLSVTLSQGENSVTRPLPSAPQGTLYAYAEGGSVGGFTVQAPTSAPASASTTAVLDVPEAWLIHPIQPSLSLPIERFVPGGEMSVAASTDETRTYASRQAIYQPNGRREAVSYPLGPRGAGSWTLVLTLENIEARNDLMTLLDDQAPVMLRSPSEADWDLPDGWYSVGDVDVSRPIDIGGVELRRATLPLTKVAEPPVRIAPQLTWGDLMLRGIKWGDLLSKTWLQALMGEV